MRKSRVAGAVLRDADVFVAGDGSFEVDEVADIAGAVLDEADGAVGEAVAVLLLADGAHVEVDDGSEVGFAETDYFAEAAEVEVGVAFGVRGDDESAAAANELVDAQVFEVAAIADVDIAAVVVGFAEELEEEREQALAETMSGP